MSEVKRYYAGNIDKDREVYLASDFDRVTAERDAALGREAAEIELRRNHAARIHELSDQVKDIQQRLTAADERADVLEGLLREVSSEARHPDYDWNLETQRAIDAALKPVECCTVSAEDRGLLEAGDYTPEELFGIGGKPSCPKCAP